MTFTKKSFLAICPWVIWVIEAMLLSLGGYKLISLQTDNTKQLEEVWNTTKEIYQLAIDKDTNNQTDNLKRSIHQKIASNIGTKVTYCKAPPRYGFKGITWSVEGLDAVTRIQALYGNIQVPCEKEWIEVKPGHIGRIREIQDNIDVFEAWFWWLGFILTLLKFLELYFRHKIQQLQPQKIQHQKAKRKK